MLKFFLGFESSLAAHHHVTKTELAPQSCHNPSNMEAKQHAVKWNLAHKAKFRSLILQQKINPKRSDTKYIDKIRAKHFADRPVSTFQTHPCLSTKLERHSTKPTKQGRRERAELLPEKVRTSWVDCCLYLSQLMIGF